MRYTSLWAGLFTDGFRRGIVAIGVGILSAQTVFAEDVKAPLAQPSPPQATILTSAIAPDGSMPACAQPIAPPTCAAPSFDRPEAMQPRSDVDLRGQQNPNANPNANAQRNNAPPSNAFASSNSQSFAPNMIGDFFGGVTGGGAGTGPITINGTQNGGVGYTADPTGTFVRFPTSDVGDVFSVLTPTAIGAANSAQAFALSENAVLTNQVQAAYGSAATFASASATGGQGGTSVVSGTYNLSFNYLNATLSNSVVIPQPGAEVGKVKLAENSSPMPRDRVFFGYSHFSGVGLVGGGGIDIDRYTPGFEKTFFNRMMSIDVRTPFASTLNSNIFTDGTTGTGDFQFGNMSTTFKTLLYQPTNRFALSGGLGLQLPTGEDTNVFNAQGTQLARVDQASVHYLPFLGYLYTPNNRFFVQGFTQFDFDGNGARVTGFNNGVPTTVGRVTDMSLMFIDTGMGYWVWQRYDRYGRFSGIAPVMEVHYNKSVDHGQVVRQGNLTIGSSSTNYENLAMTFGVNMAMRSNWFATMAYVVPVGGGSVDRTMDGEFRFLLNRFFGPMNRQTRAQF